MKLTELQKLSVAEIRAIAKACHRYANRVEAGDLAAVSQFLTNVPASVGAFGERYNEALSRGGQREAAAFEPVALESEQS